MEGVDRRRGRRSWSRRFRLKIFGCCGSSVTWDSTDMDHSGREVEEEERMGSADSGTDIIRPGFDPACVGMNLATALAVERNFRAAQDEERGFVGPTSAEAGRVPLMKLLQEGIGMEEEMMAETEREGGGVGNDTVCCVCMGRRKGAAFIPCGHTFCRVCSRELWLNRGNCPLCNRTIIEILDIY